MKIAARLPAAPVVAVHPGQESACVELTHDFALEVVLVAGASVAAIVHLGQHVSWVEVGEA